MKKKTISTMLLICFAGLLSSANQTNKNCKEEAYLLAAKSTCPVQAQKATLPEANVAPLNLFLFDL